MTQPDPTKYFTTAYALYDPFAERTYYASSLLDLVSQIEPRRLPFSNRGRNGSLKLWNGEELKGAEEITARQVREFVVHIHDGDDRFEPDDVPFESFDDFAVYDVLRDVAKGRASVTVGEHVLPKRPGGVAHYCPCLRAEDGHLLYVVDDYGEYPLLSVAYWAHFEHGYDETKLEATDIVEDSVQPVRKARDLIALAERFADEHSGSPAPAPAHTVEA